MIRYAVMILLLTAGCIYADARLAADYRKVKRRSDAVREALASAESRWRELSREGGGLRGSDDDDEDQGSEGR